MTDPGIKKNQKSGIKSKFILILLTLCLLEKQLNDRINRKFENQDLEILKITD